MTIWILIENLSLPLGTLPWIAFFDAQIVTTRFLILESYSYDCLLVHTYHTIRSTINYFQPEDIWNSLLPVELLRVWASWYACPFLSLVNSVVHILVYPRMALVLQVIQQCYLKNGNGLIRFWPEFCHVSMPHPWLIWILMILCEGTLIRIMKSCLW